MEGALCWPLSRLAARSVRNRFREITATVRLASECRSALQHALNRIEDVLKVDPGEEGIGGGRPCVCSPDGTSHRF